MENIKLENIRIIDYLNMVRSGNAKDLDRIKVIDAALNTSVGGVSGGFDLSLFTLQKDILLLQCKYAAAWLGQDTEKCEIYTKKIAQLSEQVRKKTFKKEKNNPYKAFLSWILSIEKYLGFAIDKQNDLMYLVEATKQMLNSYEAQKKQIEDNQIKRGRR